MHPDRLAAVACVLTLAAASLVAAEPAYTGKQESLWRKLQAAIEQEDRQLEGAMGVAVADLTDGRRLSYNGDEVFPTASSIKIAVLAELYHQDKLGDLYTFRPSDLVEDSQIMAGLTPGVTRVTNRDLATFVVAVSDNAATNVLIDRLGMDRVDALLDSLGLKQTRLRRKMIDIQAAREGRENTSTPREMTMLLEAIYRGKVCGPDETKDLLKVLRTRKQSNIPLYLPASIEIANKPGELEGVRTDSGIVFVPGRPFLISVMTAYVRQERAAELAISRIALAAYRYFDAVGASSSYGRRMRESPPEPQ